MPCLAERLANLTPRELEQYRSWTDAYEAAWSKGQGSTPSPDEFLPEHEPPSSLVLVQNLKVALEHLSRRPDALDPVEFLGRYPELSGDVEGRVEVLAWGSRLADSAPGSSFESFSLPSLVERFPALRDALVEKRTSLYLEQGGAFPPELVPEGSRLIHELPRGGMSRLALTWNEGVQREEVLKIIDPVGRDDPGAVERFRQEFRLAGDRAEHRVVPVYRAGTVAGHNYYTMPHLRGGSLRDRLRKGAVPLEDGVRVLAGVAREVHTLHTRQPQLVHRDLKPENLLFSGPALADAWIADLGLARLIDETADPGLTAPGNACLGTPGYMAPEQIRADGRKPGPAVDIHALGAILYELLTGRPPFFDANKAVAIQRTLEQEPLRPTGLTPRPVPPDLEVIALKALRKDPAERFQTAAELADELDRWLKGEPIRSRPPTAWTRIRSRVKRYPRTSAGAALAVVTFLGLSFLSFFLFLEERAQRQRADRTSRQVVRTLHHQVLLLTGDGRPSGPGATKKLAGSLKELAQTLNFVVTENDGEGTDELGLALTGLAAIHQALGEIPQALDASRRAEAVFASLPLSDESTFGLASARLQSGRLLFQSGKPAEGEASARLAAEALRDLVAEHPDDLEIRSLLARAEVNLGNFAREDRPQVAIAQYRRALEHWDWLCRLEVVQPRFLEWYARTQSNLGLLLVEHGEAPNAISILSEALTHAETLAQRVPGEHDTIDCLATCRTNLGEGLVSAGRPEQALPILGGALGDYEDLSRRFPEEPEGLWGVAMIHDELADALLRLGRAKEARERLQSAGPVFDRLVEKMPNEPELLKDLEKHRALIARAQSEAGPAAQP